MEKGQHVMDLQASRLPIARHPDQGPALFRAWGNIVLVIQSTKWKSIAHSEGIE